MLRRSAIPFAFATAALGAGAAYAAWNGLVATDMASLTTPRSVAGSTVIPAPEPTFGGTISRNAIDSKAW
jgi:hypothetical protein